MPLKPSIGFVCCVEAGPLEAMTVRLIESLRRSAGAMASAPVLVVNPRLGPPIQSSTCRAFRRLNARYLPSRSRERYAWYHFMNKVRAVEVAEREMGDAELIAFLDCDVLVLDEPIEFRLDENTDVTACTPPDASLASTTGPAHEREPYWRRMCDVLGMKIDDLPWVQTADGVTIRFYLAAGIFAFRRGCGLPRVFRETVTKMLDANLGIGANAEHWLEQASLGLSIVRGGLRWKRASQSHNFEIISLLRDDRRSLADAKLLHYHDSLQPHAWNDFLQRLAAQRPEHLEWIRSAGPIANPSPLPSRALAEGLRVMRGIRRSAYRRRYRAQLAQWNSQPERHASALQPQALLGQQVGT